MSVIQSADILCDNNPAMYRMAIGIEGLLKSLSVAPRIVQCVRKEQVDEFFGFKRSGEILIIMCHGTPEVKGGIRFECLHKGEDNRYYGGFYDLTVKYVDAKMSVHFPIIISAACSSGQSELARQFFNKGTKHFIAPTVDIAMMTSVMFIGTFIYNILFVHRGDIDKSVEAARNVDPSERNGDSRNYKLFT